MPRNLVAGVCLVVAFALPYFIEASQARFLFGTIGIMSTSFWMFGSACLKRCGLNIPRIDLLFGVLMSVAAYLIAKKLNFLMVYRNNNDLVFRGSRNWADHFYQFFQALNEEIILRALLLAFLAKLLKGRIFIAIVGAALIFSGLHLLLYRYFPEPAVRGGLAPMVLVNLFLFGMICNWSYYFFEHIGYPLALHAGWNLYRMNGVVRNWKQHFDLNELQAFNLIEGSWAFSGLILLSFLALCIVVKIGAWDRSRSLRGS